jgi:Domain of unknown function (DUF4372)
MLFCHLGRAQSLREICGGLAASEGKLRHLDLPDAPKRSTLSTLNFNSPMKATGPVTGAPATKTPVASKPKTTLNSGMGAGRGALLHAESLRGRACARPRSGQKPC